MTKEITTLTEEEISILKKDRSPLYFKNDFDLIYESQIPNMGIILLHGELKFVKKKKILSSIPQGAIIGIRNIINNIPFPMGLKIYKDSSILMIEKSEIVEALTRKSGSLYQIISSI